jgi:urease accessory protein
MDDLNFVTAENKPVQSALNTKHWQASLNLAFTQKHGRCFLVKNSHVGPLVLQKSLHPEGPEVCHGVVIHPPGGVAGGDVLNLSVDVENSAHALLTTPGAGKWYKSNGNQASQHLQFNVRNNASFEWLPQENILFDGAAVNFDAQVNLGDEARFLGWEILCFGRQAQNERWGSGSLKQRLRIYRDQRLIWNESANLSPEHKILRSIVGLNGNVVSASLVLAAGKVPDAILEACKALQPTLALDLHAKFGVTALPEIFSARYVGQSSQCAKAYFEALWQILRPWYASREALRPRIWNT